MVCYINSQWPASILAWTSRETRAATASGLAASSFSPAAPAFTETKQLRTDVFILVSPVAGPDFRWQQGWIPAAANAAEPQGNHADFIVGTGRPWSGPIRIRK
jgi:hypothetical protein